MDLKRRAVLATIGASTIAGCLGGDGNGGETASQTDGSDGDGGAGDGDEPDDATVRVRSHPELGDVLVGPDGMTLYNFDTDTQGASESSCDEDCLDSWPPLTAESEPVAGPDVTAELTTFERDDGTMHVAANGWPLYYFAGDTEPGDVEGQGANDVWWVLDPTGTPIRDGDGDGDEDEDGDGDDEGGGNWDDGPTGVY